MRRSTSWFLPRALGALSLLALSSCVEGTTSSGTAATPNEAIGSTNPAKPATPVTPASPATPAAPVTGIAPIPATTAVTPVVPATPATPSTIPTVAATANPSTAPGVTPAAGTTLVGTWESPSCGDRAYARRITFTEAATASFTAEDLVSPCPKGTQCIWSGIINRSGTYKTQKDIVTLTVSKTSTGPAKTQFPATLTLDASRAPIEAGSDGKPCAYKAAGGARKP